VSLPSLSVKNHVLVNMMMVIILVAGGAFAFTLVREMFPEIRPDRLAIFAVYNGVHPEEIEKAITIKIEEAVRDIEGVEKVESTVGDSLSSTAVSLFNDVEDVDVVLQEVKNAVDSIEDLPDDLNRITIRKMEPRLPVISVAIFGSGTEVDLKRAGRELRDDLLLLPGVSDVQLTGTRDDEISVEIRPERLLEYNVTFAEVADAIRRTNIDVSGGNLKGKRTSISVRTLGEKLRGDELLDIVVRGESDGRTIHIRDVADIRDEFIESDLEAYFNGKPQVSCNVYKTRSQDVIQIATLIKAYVAGKQNEPFDAYGFEAAADTDWYLRPVAYAGAGVSWLVIKITGRPDPATFYEQSRKTPFASEFDFALHTDLSRFVEGRLDLLLRNGRTGLLLVLISLNLFLNWRVAFWAAIGLPVSFLGTFIVMWQLGVTINLLTMFGLIIVLGIIVDDAIVIGENIYRHVEEGMPPIKAAVKGAEEVMWPVTIAVLTTIAAFAPLFFIKGQIGDFMGQLPIVVLAALSVSLVEALVILPAHLAHLPSKQQLEEKAKRPPRFGAISRSVRRCIRFKDSMLQSVLPDIYERFLRFALKWRYVTVAVSVSTLLLAAGMVAGEVVESVFVQEMDGETMICALEMPVGTTADNTKRRLEHLSDLANSMDEVANVQMFVSRQYDIEGAGALGDKSQSHLGQLVIELHASDARDAAGQRSSQQLLTVFRAASDGLAGVNSVTWQSLSGGPGGKDIHIQITGKNFDEIVEVAEELKVELKGYKGVFDLDDDFDEGKREVRLTLRESARPTGITVGMLGQQVRSAMYGDEARRVTRNREDVRIMVRYPEDFRKNVYNLESMWIPTPDVGAQRDWVPLGEVAQIKEAESFATLHRSQQERSVTVFGDVNEDVAKAPEILEKIRRNFDDEIVRRHPGVRIEFLGSYEERTKAFSGLKLALVVALLVIYMLLAGLFRSYFQPLVVMAAIPFGFQGAVVGHWMTGNPITILSYIGMVALTGIIVNDSLVLVDFINSRVRRGMSHFEASVKGARLRLRAILLTTLTTAAGLTPMMFETSFQAKFLIPMAVTLTFGLVFATALTLVLVPALNMVYFDCLVALRRKRTGWADDLDAPDDETGETVLNGTATASSSSDANR